MTDWDHTFDAVIVGSGGGGMVAGLAGRSRGLDVLVLEKTEFVGGSTALSGGGLWMPNNPLMGADGVPDSEGDALKYFDAIVGDAGPASSPERRRAYVTEGPRMVSFLQQQGIVFSRAEGWPDYYSEAPGASVRGRTIEAVPYDINALGEWKEKLRPGMTVRIAGIAGTMKELMIMSFWNRSVGACALSARVMARTIAGKLRRQSLVCLGGSLMGQMLKVAVDRGIPIWTESPLKELVVEDGRVVGAVIEREGTRLRIKARHGVLLAAGGFSLNQEMRGQYFGDPTMATRSRANPGDTGEVLQMAVALGAATDNMDTAIWNVTPVMPDGSSPPPYPVMQSISFPRSRQRPGTIIVDASGSRYANEAASYMEVGQKMIARNKEVRALPSWMIFDDASRRRYNFGWIPGRLPEQWIRDGYIKRSETLHALAEQCGIDPAGLEATVSRFNADARQGLDPQFHRGYSAYDQFLGDPRHRPNRSIAPLEKAPYYAAAVYPTDIGTVGGVLTDEHARVLRADRQSIPGLYATGNVTASVMGRAYLGAGASIGPTCTFGFVAINEMADQAATAAAAS